MPQATADPTLNEPPSGATRDSSGLIDMFDALDRQPAQKPEDLATMLNNMDAQRQAQAVHNLALASGSDPVKAAQALDVSKRTGIPQPAVEENLQQATDTAKLTDNVALIKTSPQVADFVADNPLAARLAHDDLPALHGVAQSLMAMPYATLQGFGGGFSKAATSLNSVIGWLTGQTDPESWWQRNMVAPRVAAESAFEPDKSAGLPGKLAEGIGGVGAMIPQVVLSGGASEAPAAMQAVGAGKAIVAQLLHGARAMLEPALVDAVDTGRKVYETTGDTGQAIKAAQGQFLATAATGGLPMSIAGNLGARLASGALVGASTSEVSRQAMNTVLPDQMKQPFDIDQVILGGLTGSLMGGSLGPRAFEGSRVQAGAEATQAIKGALDAAEQSALRERSPDAFHHFVEQANANGPVQDVYVDARTLADALANSKDAKGLGELIPSVRDQMPEALSVGGDVKIPMADLLTYLPGTDLQEALVPHLRTSPGGMSEAEAASRTTTADERLRSTIDDLEASYKADQPGRDGFSDAYARLIAEGNDPQTASSQATAETRDSIGRTLAADASVAAARREQGLEPLLDRTNMTEAEYQTYADHFAAAHAGASEEVHGRVTRELARQTEAWWKDERAKMREQIDAENQAHPAGAAIPDLQRGVHPDLIAERLGFDTGADLLDAVAALKARMKGADAEASRRMLETHGDMLNDGSIADRATEAVHNDRQAEVFQTEMRILKRRGANGEPSTIDTAKAIAKRVIGSKVIADLNPDYYARAAAKAGREAEQAMLGKEMAMGLARNLDTAFAAKQRQLLAHFLFREATAAKDAVQKGLEYQRKFDRNSIREKLPGSFVEQIDALRDQYDFRVSPGPLNAKKESLVRWAESQRESGFEPAITDWLAEFTQRAPYRTLTVDQFNAVVNAIRSIEHIAREQNLITVAGKRVDLAATVAELLEPLKQRGDRFTKEQLLQPPEAGVDSATSVLLHKLGTWLRLSHTDLQPQEFRRNKLDNHDLFGPFGKYLFDRMFDQNYWKTDQLKSISDAFGKKAAELGKDWQKSLYDLVPNKTLMDPDLGAPGERVPMKLTRGRMLGIARHVGNESNFDKLTKGMGWQPETVWSFLHEHMTAKDWQATQAQWDIFESYWPQIEGLARRLGGVPPEKIPIRGFDTRFGPMKGGYSPIDYDPIRSKLGAKFGEIALSPSERISEPPAYRSTTTFNGSMVNRNEGYTDRINLDFHAIEGRLRDTVHDLAYREALIDASKIIKHPDFRSQFMKSYGREEYAGLQKWLLGIKGMHAGEDDIRGFEKALQYTRTGVVMTGIAYRLSTVLVHGGSAALKTLGYLGDAAGTKYFASRVARMGTGNAREDIAGASEKFAEIRTRLLQMDRDYKVGSRSLFEPEDWRAKNDRFGHAMVAWSDALTAVPTAWAAYDRAIAEGIPKAQGGTGKPMAEADAVAYANKIVREAHGTALETNRSLFMQSRGIKGLFGTIYGFMNNTYGQLGDMLDKAVAGGHYRDKPALVARALGTIIVPALWAAYIKHGEPDEDEPWYTWAAKAITGELAGTVPFVRDAWSMLEYSQSSSEVAPIRILHDIVKTGNDVIGEFSDKETKLIQDAANALGELLHIGGLGQLGKTAQYLRELYDEKQNPESALELVHDAALGHKGKS